MEKVRFWEEQSACGSQYLNWELLDDELKDEFECEVGYESSYTVRYSDHNRPDVVSGLTTYEHSYFFDTRDKEDFENAKKYLKIVVNKFCNRVITVEELDSLLFNKDWKNIKDYLENM